MQITEVKVKGEAERLILPQKEIGALLKEGSVEGIFKYNAADRSVSSQMKGMVYIDHKGHKDNRPTGTATITTSKPDRDGDIVRSDGGIIPEVYIANPIVLPMHGYNEFPIGLTRSFHRQKTKIAAVWEFLVDQPDTKGAVYHRLWEDHILNCVSIGFIPLEWDERKDWTFDFTKWELLEYSLVTIPANREAQRKYLDIAGKMIDTSPVMKGLYKGTRQIVKKKKTEEVTEENEVQNLKAVIKENEQIIAQQSEKISRLKKEIEALNCDYKQAVTIAKITHEVIE